MQVVPHTTVPRSTLTPMQVRNKFNSLSLAGLGGCITDDTGACIADAGPTITSDTPSLWLYGSDVPPTLSTPVTPQTNSLWFYNSSAAPTLYAGPGASQSAISQIIASLANMGVQIAKITQLQPGQTLLPNGTIVGAGQTYLPGQGVTGSSLAAIFTNPSVVMMLALGLIVIGAAEKG